MRLFVVLSFALAFAAGTACKQKQASNPQSNTLSSVKATGPDAEKLYNAMIEAKMPTPQNGAELTLVEFSYIGCKEATEKNSCEITVSSGIISAKDNTAVNLANALRQAGVGSNTAPDGMLTEAFDGSCRRELDHVKGYETSCELKARTLSK